MNGTLQISDMLSWQYSIPHSRLFRVVELTVSWLWSRIIAGTVFSKMEESSKKINLFSEKIANSFTPYVHNRVPGCPPPYIFINYFLKFFFFIWAPGSSGFDFFRSYLIGYECKKKIFFHVNLSVEKK